MSRIFVSRPRVRRRCLCLPRFVRNFTLSSPSAITLTSQSTLYACSYWNMVRSPSLASALVAAAAAPPCHASFFVQTHLHRRYSRNNSGMSLSLLHHHPSSSFASSSSSSRRRKSASINYVHNGDEKNEEHSNEPKTKKELDITQLNQKPQITPNFLDTILEIPDPKLFTGDLLFLLIVNFLLQIASEVSTSEFWLNGGFYQPIAMPSTTLLGVVVRDSKMSIAWILSALWNRSYAYSSVSNDETAVKVAIQVWIDYCSLRILLELGESIGFTHLTVNIWSLGMEVWYTVVIMAFFRLAYSRMTLFR